MCRLPWGIMPRISQDSLDTQPHTMLLQQTHSTGWDIKAPGAWESGGGQASDSWDRTLPSAVQRDPELVTLQASCPAELCHPQSPGRNVAMVGLRTG